MSTPVLHRLLGLAVLSLVPISAQAQQSLRGDVDGDGRVTAADAQAVRDYVAGRAARAGLTLLPNGDANGDGRITGVDAAIIQAFAAGRDLGRFGMGESVKSAPEGGSYTMLQECTVDVQAGTQSCQTPRPATGASADVLLGKPFIGYVTTANTSSRVNPANEDTTRMTVALTSQMGQPIGTTDGVNPAPTGNRVFFSEGPRVTAVHSGTVASASIRVEGTDGTANFSSPDGAYTRTGKPYFQYNGVLAKGATSAPKAWRFIYSANTRTFSYTVAVSAPVQYEYGWVTIAAAPAAVANRLPAGARASLSAAGAEHGMVATVHSITGAAIAEAVTWSSSNPAVASIDASTGMMTDVSDGTTIITATSTVDPRRTGSAPMSIAVPPPAYAAGLVVSCHADIAGRSVSCNSTGDVYLQAGNASAAGGMLSFDMAIQNLLPEAIGTPDGDVVDTAGVRLFIASTSVQGTGTVLPVNASGTRFGQPFYGYPQKLAKDEVSAGKRWQIAYGPGVTSFDFQVQVRAEIQPLLVINEMMVNPNVVLDTSGEWFEVYNAGRYPVEMKGMLLADSAASGRRDYQEIGASLVVQPGAYVVLGNNGNSSTNGGAHVDYVYPGYINFMNSLDALKISRVYAGVPLTIDRMQYASAAVSAQDGVSRELRNPGLDNVNMDGSNWANASVTSVYGPAGRGTPGAQNSTYTP